MNTRTLVAVVCAALLSGLAGWLAATQLRAPAATGGGGGDGPCPGGAPALYWKAPMDPTYVRNEPGKSPMGMDLVPVCPGEDTQSAQGGVRIDPAIIQRIGVRTAPVERRDLARPVRAVGRVAYDERLVSHVHTKIQGWIERLHVEYEGQMVRRGQPMIEIYSPELLATQEELLLAARYRDQTASSPFEDVREGGSRLFEATRRRLELWDVPDRDIDRLLESGRIRKTLTLYAPSGGVVVHMMARQGMEVGANDNLYTIADLSRVWIYAEVYEYELPWVDEEQRASVALRTFPGRTFDAVVTYVYPFLDARTRTARVRLELDNPGLLFKPEMFADVTIATAPRKGVLSIPEEAVIRSGRRSLVIVSKGNGRFEPRKVELGVESADDRVEVLSGLAEGEQVVTSGQFLIDSESRLQEAVQKMLSDGEQGAKEAATPMPPGHAMPAPERPGAAMPMPAGAMEHDGPMAPPSQAQGE